MYLITAALLGRQLLPLFIHCPPFSYREVLSTAGEAVVTALATTAGLILIDSRKDDFSSLGKTNDIKNLTMGIPSSRYYKKLSHKFFLNATLVGIDSTRKFVKGQYKNVDALIYSTETGSA